MIVDRSDPQSVLRFQHALSRLLPHSSFRLGVYDVFVVKAVKRYQMAHKLPVTGELSEGLLHMMEQELTHMVKPSILSIP